MYGRLGRIGLLVLDSDLTIEPDLRRILPEGIETHAARVIYPRRVTAENLEIAANGAVAAVEQLLPIRPAVIAWACTSGSFYGGKAGNARLNARLAEAAGIPVTTASTALAAAMAELGIKRPAVGSAYSPAVNERLTAYLRECVWSRRPCAAFIRASSTIMSCRMSRRSKWRISPRSLRGRIVTPWS